MKHNLYVKLLILFALLSTTFACVLMNRDKPEVIQGLTYNVLKTVHYSNLDIDDVFSQKVFKGFIDDIDNDHRFFLESDFKKFEKYNSKIDDQIRSNEMTFFDLVYETLMKRQIEIKKAYETIIQETIDLEKDEYLEIIKDNDKFFKNQKELANYWRKLIKYDVLLNLKSLEETQENKRKLSDTVTVKTLDQLKKEAVERVKKSWNDYFERLSKLTKEDYFNIYINSILTAADAHSEYYPPKNKEDFDIQMSGELEGIGATLSQQFGEIKVVEIVPGSPAWKDGQIEKGDIILAVAQEGKESVNISSMRLDDAVRLIRGKKGTVVILTIKKIDGSMKDVRLVRDKIVIEETFIRSIIIENENGVKTAYLQIPSFYINFQVVGGRSCSEDFKKELIKLRKEKVNNIIVDVRNNGGGSLQEVVKIAGFFIEKGPIVQVKERNSNTRSLDDVDASVLFDGNVLVLTNYFSASASEIFAAALQDYNRAIIFGNKQSLGKGTVQEILDLDRFINSQYKPLGAIKLTIQKFYRINGSSTQLKGVASDIIYPSVYDKIDISEASLKNPMPYDQISKTKYKIFDFNFNKDSVIFYAQNRIIKDSLLILSNNYAKVLSEDYEIKTIPLSYKKFKEYNDSKLSIKNNYDKYITSHSNTNLTFKYLQDDQNQMQNDTIMKQRYNVWVSRLKRDTQIGEALRIIADMEKFKN